MSGIITDNLGRSTGLIKAAGGGGAMELITSATFAESTSIEISSLGSDYIVHKFYMTIDSNNDVHNCHMHLSTGGSYATTNYHWMHHVSNSGQGAQNENAGNQSSCLINQDEGRNNKDAVLEMDMYNWIDTADYTYPTAVWTLINQNDQQEGVLDHGGLYMYNWVTAVDAFKFVISAGHYTGEYWLYGIKKSS